MKKNKQGSALLIVLGFLSFMVVSAVAFAIYMRSERLPSSAVRRVIATRHLVKAAMAEAISRVDDAVRDDPFPGLCATNNNGTVANSGDAKYYYFSEDAGGKQAIDVWSGRVFMPPAEQGGTVDGFTRFAPVTETVSVLNLEALGYLPPDLVNDVRFLSRSSWAASWHQFLFDAGRFAYCAVNVSDYLDINRVPAYKPRTADPMRRLSVAHLFDNKFNPEDAYKGDNIPNNNTVCDPVQSEADKFDKFTGKDSSALYKGYAAGDNVGGGYESWQAIGNESPYVSMLDYNLALAAAGPNTSLLPLYYNWLANDRPNNTYYIQGGNEAKAAMRQPFVTDSWSTNETWEIDIATIEGQPFRGMASMIKEQNGRHTYTEVLNRANNNPFFSKMSDLATLVGFADIATLYDYLDHNNVPLSVAIPCVERVPMITGISPPQIALGKFQVNGEETKIWTFDARNWFQGKPALRTLITYPFKRELDLNSGDDFKAQTFLRVVLAPPGEAVARKIAEKMRPTQEDWNAGGAYSRQDDGVMSFTFLSNQKSINIDDRLTEESKAYVRGAGTDNGVLQFWFSDCNDRDLPTSIEALKCEEVQEDVINADGTKTSQTVKKYTVLCKPFDANGNVLDCKAGMNETEFGAISGTEYVLHAFAWVRIVNGDNKTVDLVPACPYDDQIVNPGKPQDAMITYLSALSGANTDAARPVFSFSEGDQGMKLTFGAIASDTFNGGVDAKWEVEGIYAVDPRFNYAPQHWYNADTKDIKFDDWLDKTKKAMRQYNDAYTASDIFMFVSNQGFLQSIGEFGFLPFLHRKGEGVNFAMQPIDTSGGKNYNSAITDPKQIMDSFDYLWRTYDPAEIYEETERFRISRSHQKEQLVNPHTDKISVMMAALANTPIDYRATAGGMDDVCALIKEFGNDDTKQLRTFSDAKKYAFNENQSMSGTATFDYDVLIQIAKTIMTSMGGFQPETSEDVYKFIKAEISEAGAKGEDLRGAIAQKLKKYIRQNRILPSDAWKKLWDELWNNTAFDLNAQDKDNGSFKEFLGVGLDDPLHGVDRKFLYSYWRDCFANNQQLFLVFVRAESGALGGPGEGTPSQQGGRAVALVWRDPNWSENDGRDRDEKEKNEGNLNYMRPHRTRVLFYHQFD